MDSGRLSLSLVGAFKVTGQIRAPLPAGKALRLLKLLAASDGRFVGSESIVDALWPTHPPDKVERNIAALVSRLRRSLGADLLVGGPAGYRLVLDDVDVDVFAAQAQIIDAEHQLARGMYGVAITGAELAEAVLGSGTPLGDEPDAPWVERLRQEATRLLHRARVCRWTAALELAEYSAAAEAASAALSDDPIEEEACRALMRACARSGTGGEALVAYESLRTTLRKRLGVDPSSATQEVYLAVLRNEWAPGDELPAPAHRPQRGPLVERAEELDYLRQVWSGAASGSGRVVVVVGEAGIGKSALVNALAEEARRSGLLALTTRCYEVERSLYLQPILEVVRAVVGRTPAPVVRELTQGWTGTLIELVPEIGTLIGVVPYERAEPEIEHQRSLNALVSFFHGLTERQPVLLFVDDLQHAGQSTIEALEFLATRLSRWRMLVVVAERSSVDEPASAAFGQLATRVRLGPLSRSAVKLMVDRTSLDYDIDQLYEWTNGSPLFVTELLRQAKITGDGILRIPESLHDAVRDRIAHAGPEVALLLQQGSILGSTFTLDDLAELGEGTLEGCARVADRALRAALLTAQGATFRFANDVVRQIAYTSAPEPARISRHRKAAKMLADRPEAAAHQLVASQDWPAAADAWMEAAEAARVTFGNIDAERMLTEALTCAERSRDDILIAEARIRRGQIRSERGQHAQARDDHDVALAIAQAHGDEVLEARVLEQLGWTALFARDAMGAVDLASRASHLAESAAAAPGAMPGALLLLGRVRHWDGDYAGAGQAYSQALAADADPSTTARALVNQGALLAHLDRFEEACSTLERAIRLCRRTGQFRSLLQALFFTALARGNSGHLQAALGALDQASRLLDEYGVGFYRAGIETNLSWLWRELGDHGRAREHATRALELAERGGGALELEQELHALLALADCDLLAGRDDDARSRVEAAAPFLELSLPYQPRATMRLLEMRARWEPPVAEALLETARTYASPKYESLALHRLGRQQEAAEVAERTGSDLVIAECADLRTRRAALDRLAANLSPELRPAFLARGRLARGLCG